MSTHSASASFTGALATPHALATEAGMRAYRDGGNAIDAAIVAAAVLTVVYPHNVTLGGDLVALLRTPDGVVRCVNASGWAGGAVDAAGLRATHGRWSARARRRRGDSARRASAAGRRCAASVLD